MMSHEHKEHEEELMECAEAVRILGDPVVKASFNVAAGDKTVHFVRHGEAEHNAFARVWREEGREGSPYLSSSGCPVDPPLTHAGRTQAREAGETLAERLGGDKVPALCSPLRRAAQTALIAQTALGEKKDADSLFFSSLTALMDLRERFGLHVCDSLGGGGADEFPSVDWTQICPPSQDAAARMDCREPYVDLVSRARRVIRHIGEMPQREVVVFSHSALMLALVNGALQADEEAIKKWFSVGEVRTLHLKWN